MEETYTIGENRWVKTKHGWVLVDNLKPSSESGMTPQVRKNGKRVKLHSKKLSDKPPRMGLWGKIKSIIIRRKKSIVSPVEWEPSTLKAMEAATSQPCYVREEEE